MQCNTALKKSIQAFYNDMQFLRKHNGTDTKPSRAFKRRAGGDFMLLSTMNTVHLSSRQCDVLALMKTITSRKQIAKELNISIKTLEDHLLTMRKKMNCQSVQDMFDLVQQGKLLQAA